MRQHVVFQYSKHYWIAMLDFVIVLLMFEKWRKRVKNIWAVKFSKFNLK